MRSVDVHTVFLLKKHLHTYHSFHITQKHNTDLLHNNDDQTEGHISPFQIQHTSTYNYLQCGGVIYTHYTFLESACYI